MKPRLACHGGVYKLNKNKKATVTLSLLKLSTSNPADTNVCVFCTGRDVKRHPIRVKVKGKQPGCLFDDALNVFDSDPQSKTFSRDFTFDTPGIYIMTIFAQDKKCCPTHQDVTGAHHEILEMSFPFRVKA